MKRKYVIYHVALNLLDQITLMEVYTGDDQGNEFLSEEAALDFLASADVNPGVKWTILPVYFK